MMLYYDIPSEPLRHITVYRKSIFKCRFLFTCFKCISVVVKTLTVLNLLLLLLENLKSIKSLQGMLFVCLFAFKNGTRTLRVARLMRCVSAGMHRCRVDQMFTFVVP